MLDEAFAKCGKYRCLCCEAAIKAIDHFAGCTSVVVELLFSCTCFWNSKVAEFFNSGFIAGWARKKKCEGKMMTLNLTVLMFRL